MTDILTLEERARLVETAKAATPGPWFVKSAGHGMGRLAPVAIVCADTDSIAWTEQDYAHIASASPDTTLRWEATVQALEARVAYLEADKDNWRRYNNDRSEFIAEVQATLGTNLSGAKTFQEALRERMAYYVAAEQALTRERAQAEALRAALADLLDACDGDYVTDIAPVVRARAALAAEDAKENP